MIESAMYHYLKRNAYWWVMPELDYKFRADFIAWGSKKGVLEVEIKRTWADYRHDYVKSVDSHLNWAHFNKKGRDITHPKRFPTVQKHNWLKGNYPCNWRPEYFMYAAEPELAKRIADDPALPKGFGVVKVRNENNVYSLKRVARLITLTPEQHGRFRKDVFKRAMSQADKFYSDRLYNERNNIS